MMKPHFLLAAMCALVVASAVKASSEAEKNAELADSTMLTEEPSIDDVSEISMDPFKGKMGKWGGGWGGKWGVGGWGFRSPWFFDDIDDMEESDVQDETERSLIVDDHSETMDATEADDPAEDDDDTALLDSEIMNDPQLFFRLRARIRARIAPMVTASMGSMLRPGMPSMFGPESSMLVRPGLSMWRPGFSMFRPGFSMFRPGFFRRRFGMFGRRGFWRRRGMLGGRGFWGRRGLFGRRGTFGRRGFWGRRRLGGMFGRRFPRF